MVRKYLARNIGYPLQDIIMKTNILDTLIFLRKSQFWEETLLEEYRFEKLKRLIEFSYRNVPYYEKLFRSLRLTPGDIKSLKDIEKIPILSKEKIRREGRNLIARNFNMKYVKTGKTGGTTGPPLVVYKDTNCRSFTWASYYRWYEWMGIEYGDRVATLWGARTVLTKSLKKGLESRGRNILQNKLDINSFEMDQEGISKMYEKLFNFRPSILKGYLSALLNLARYIEQNSLERPDVKVLSSTSETLFPHNRSYLEKVFGAPVYDQYGCGELSAISYECSKHGGLHINQEHILCEILDEKDSPIIEKPGRVIGTDLDNFVMPFIRFENGDIATLYNHKCKCGVNQPLMKSIEGRSIDTITLKNGSKVHGVFFTDIFYELGIMADNIQRFQIHQNNARNIEVRLETKKQLDSTVKNKLVKALDPFFSHVDIIETHQLQNDESGKFRYIINEGSFCM